MENVQKPVVTAKKGSKSARKSSAVSLSLVLRTSAVVFFTATVAGCSSLNIGSSDFACPGYPDGVQCMSTRDVYAATNDGGVPNAMGSNVSEAQSFDAHWQDTKGQLRGTNIDPVRDPVSAYVAPRLPDKPVPVRTPAQVMRIWVAPWEDTNGDLNVSGYLYTEIEPRRWILGDPAPSSNPVLSPLTVRSVSAKGATSQSNKQAEPLRQSDVTDRSSDFDDNLEVEN